MNVSRSRIIVEYRDDDFLNQLKQFANINILYKSKENYALICCDKKDEEKIVKLLSKTCLNAYVSNEKIDNYNF